MKTKYKFDEYEVGIIINALIELRNQLIREGRYTDAVDELLIKLCNNSCDRKPGKEIKYAENIQLNKCSIYGIM